MTNDSLAVAIEALSWIAYSGIGERAALFRAADQLGVTAPGELRQAYRLIMETIRFENRLLYLISRSSRGLEHVPHGLTSFLKILAYLKYVDNAREKELERNVAWARQILGWKELHPYERAIAQIASCPKYGFGSNLPEFEKLSLETCHPTWFVERMIRQFGRPFALDLLRRNLSVSPVYVRLNSLKIRSQTERDKVREQIRGLDVPGIEDVWMSKNVSSLRVQSTLHESGEIVVQDLASITAGLVASPRPGATVLDVCAGPGNKTSHLADVMQNDGEIYSIDISSRRLATWKSEMRRTGVTIAVPVLADARAMPFKLVADVVLVDPPCSNSGVFGKTPSMKWRVTPARVNEFALQQYSILQAASQHVGRSGTLVYCTCSVLPEEDEMVIERFLRWAPDFRVVDQTPMLGLPALRGFDQCQRFYPHIHDCNGYFIAKLQRVD